MMASFSKKWKRDTVSTDLWFSRKFYDLPEFKLQPLDSNVFASFSGPDCGLSFVQNFEEPYEKKENTDKKIRIAHEQLIAGCLKWNLKNRKAYGISMSLYDQHPVNGKITGDPIADCFGLCARGNSAIMVVADGVNWGEKSRLAARCAVYGAMKHINEKIFSNAMNCEAIIGRREKDDNHIKGVSERSENDAEDEAGKICMKTKFSSLAEELGVDCSDERNSAIETTKDLFRLMLTSLESAHKIILKHEGGLTTLCICLVCPITDSLKGLPEEQSMEASHLPAKKYVACVVNVGDSLAFVFSRRHGVREITTGSHDVTLERNIRDAGGAIGPVSETGEPELHNLTCSITCVEAGDIVFLATDGITDNFDPVVTKVAAAKKMDDHLVPDSIISCERKGASENFGFLDKLCDDTSAPKPLNIKDLFEHCSTNNNLAKDTSSDGVSSNLNINCMDMAWDSSSIPSESHATETTSFPITTKSSDQPGSVSSEHVQTGKLNSGNDHKFIVTNPEESSNNFLTKDISAEELLKTNPPDIKSKSLKMSDEVGLENGKPVMLPFERHRYAIKEMERVIHEFELFTETPCSAQELCGALLQHVLRLTDPKRKVLENPDLYGKKKRLKAEERQNRDSEIVLRLAQSPGKLDHATVLGYEVGCYHGNEDEHYYTD